MKVHFNDFRAEYVVKEGRTIKFPPFVSMNNQLSSSLVFITQFGVSQNEKGFKALVEALLKKYSPMMTFEALVHSCINDGHIKNEKEARYVAFSDDSFLLAVDKEGLWKVKILDYEKYGGALKKICDGLKILTCKGFLQSANGVLSIQDGDNIIHFHFAFCKKNELFYPVQHGNFEKISCFAKARGPKGDLFVFRYEEPLIFDGAVRLNPLESRYEDNSFELKLKFGDEFNEPVNFVVSNKKSGKFVCVYVARSGRAHSLWLMRWYPQHSMVFCAKNLDTALDELYERIANRGFEFVNYEKFKQDVYEAEKRALSKNK